MAEQILDQSAAGLGIHAFDSFRVKVGDEEHVLAGTRVPAQEP